MNYKLHLELIAEAEKHIGKEITLLKELPNKEQEKKKFKLVEYYEKGTGEITDPVFTKSDNPKDYPSWGAWGILQAQDGQEIKHFSLRLILDTILSGKELEYNY